MFDELNKTYGASNAQPSANFGTIEGIANTVANLVVGAAFSISTITLAYAFVQFLLTQGDVKYAEKAQKAATYSAIAMLVALTAYGLKSAAFKLVGL